MRRIRHIRHAVAACALVTVLAAAGTAPAVAATDDAATIEAAIDAAEARAADAGARALDAAVTADTARAAAEKSAAVADALDARRRAAEEVRSRSSALAGAVASAMARDRADGSPLMRLLADADPDSLLDRLALSDRIAAVAQRTGGAARVDAAVAAALAAQASVADAERERAAAAAADDATRARDQARNEDAAVTAARGELDALYARLAAVRQTSVAVEKQERLDRATASLPSAGGETPITTAPAPAPAPVPAPAPAPAPAPGPAPEPAPAPVTPIMTPAEAQAHARGAIGGYGWGDEQFSCLVSLWNRESGWRVQARNPSSGAYGIPQAYPAESLAKAGPDWRTNGATQIAWGLSYISSRYGSPCGAWDHSERTGWY